MPKVTSEQLLGLVTSKLIDRLEAEYQAGIAEDEAKEIASNMEDFWKHQCNSPD